MSAPDNGDYLLVSLAAVRRHYGVTQVELAKAMGTTQSAISRIENQPGVHASTLVKYVQALGGRLHLVVEHPLGPVEIRLPCPGCGSTRSAHKWPIRSGCRGQKNGS